MAIPTVRGRFVWHELMTTDTESAGAFYTKVVGWTKQTWDQDASYQMFATSGVPMAGYLTLPEGAPQMGASPHWLSYVGTPDVDATARYAEQLGATVLKSPSDIPGSGRFCDPGPAGGRLLGVHAEPGAPRRRQADPR
jgi:hypothetical protein